MRAVIVTAEPPASISGSVPHSGLAADHSGIRVLSIACTCERVDRIKRPRLPRPGRAELKYDSASGLVERASEVPTRGRCAIQTPSVVRQICQGILSIDPTVERVKDKR